MFPYIQFVDFKLSLYKVFARFTNPVVFY